MLNKSLTENTFVWAAITVVIVAIILFFGLRLRGPGSTNNVQWLADQKTLRFSNLGIAYVDDLRTIRLNKRSTPFTIEMAVTPGIRQRQGFSPLIMLHDGSDEGQIAIWQYAGSLVVMNGDDYDFRRRWPRVTAKDVLQAEKTNYISITSDSKMGTRLYIDGELTAENSDWSLKIPIAGEPLHLVLGNSVYGYHGWTGDIHGLSISGEALSEEGVRRRYDRWSVERNFDFMKRNSQILLYTFDQKVESRFIDGSGYGQDLRVPSHVVALKRSILAPPGPHVRINWTTSFEIVVNIVGFIPLGAVLIVFLQSFGNFSSRYKWVAVAFCMLLSLGIELAQVWIPTRFSTMQDLILNTLGGWIGVELGLVYLKVMNDGGEMRKG